MAEDKADLFTQYHNIAHKLRKKRLLKKPNVAEASQQFESLGINFEREDLMHYSGLCYQAAAKCQNSLGNTLEEGLLLLKSSRQFMFSYSEDLKNRCVLNPSFLNHSCMLYKDCLERLKESEELSELVKESLMGTIILQMADNLKEQAGFKEESCQEYEKALSLFSGFPIEKINCLKKIISLKIELGDYKECLNLVNNLIEESKYLSECGFKENIMRESEVTRVFLLLILQPTLQQISPTAASVLEKYAWVETSSSNDVKDLSAVLQNHGLLMLGEELFLNLQSLVMACQYNDSEDLELLEKYLIDYLTNEQKTLLQILIKQYKK